MFPSRLTNVKKIHMIGIKGAGMTALAEILISRNIRVTGSDTEEVFYTDALLHALHITPFVGFASEQIPEDVEMIIYSSSYTIDRNAELRSAFDSGKPVLSYPEALGELTKERLALAVCGTHGKTTTTGLLAECLREAGKDPQALVGGKVGLWGKAALSGSGEYFVFEADEYQNKFEYYTPFGVILNNVEWDHPDFFPDMNAYRKTFGNFLSKIPRHGFLAYCEDDAEAVKLSSGVATNKLSYGFHKEAGIRIVNHEVITDSTDGLCQRFSLEQGSTSLGVFESPLAGTHNAVNIAGAVALCSLLSIDIDAVRTAVRKYSGTERRFEYIGKTKEDALIYDDYAHHPTEVKATLAAFRSLFPTRKLTVVFHPHTYSRTEALLSDFSQSFGDATRVIVIDVYGSAREKTGAVGSAELVSAINHFESGKAELAHDFEEAENLLRDTLEKEDIVITMGAGDVWKLGRTLIS